MKLLVILFTILSSCIAYGQAKIPYIPISDPISEGLLVGVTAEFTRAAQANVPALVVEINSPGGDVDAGFKISKLIEQAPFRVFCIVDGEAASMAFYILQSCDARIMTERSLLMWHEISSGFRVNGNVDYFKRLGEQMTVRLTMMQKAANRHIAHRLSISPEEVGAKVEHGGEWWLDIESALNVGAVDIIAKTVRDARRMILIQISQG